MTRTVHFLTVTLIGSGLICFGAGCASDGETVETMESQHMIGERSGGDYPVEEQSETGRPPWEQSDAKGSGFPPK